MLKKSFLRKILILPLKHFKALKNNYLYTIASAPKGSFWNIHILQDVTNQDLCPKSLPLFRELPSGPSTAYEHLSQGKDPATKEAHLHPTIRLPLPERDGACKAKVWVHPRLRPPALLAPPPGLEQLLLHSVSLTVWSSQNPPMPSPQQLCPFVPHFQLIST